jgi:hypothetical protein
MREQLLEEHTLDRATVPDLIVGRLRLKVARAGLGGA